MEDFKRPEGTENNSEIDPSYTTKDISIKERFKKWYKNRYLFQAIVGGFVVSLFLVIWIKEYYQPITMKKQILAEYEILIQGKKNIIDKEELENKEKELTLKEKDLKSKEKKIEDYMLLIEEKEELQEKLKEITMKYEELQNAPPKEDVHNIKKPREKIIEKPHKKVQQQIKQKPKPQKKPVKQVKVKPKPSKRIKKKPVLQSNKTSAQSGTIFISSFPPMAEVYMDGKYIGITSKDHLKITSGTHTMEFRKGDIKVIKKMTFKPGKNPSKLIRLKN